MVRERLVGLLGMVGFRPQIIWLDLTLKALIASMNSAHMTLVILQASASVPVRPILAICFQKIRLVSQDRCVLLYSIAVLLCVGECLQAGGESVRVLSTFAWMSCSLCGTGGSVCWRYRTRVLCTAWGFAFSGCGLCFVPLFLRWRVGDEVGPSSSFRSHPFAPAGAT